MRILIIFLAFLFLLDFVALPMDIKASAEPAKLHLLRPTDLDPNGSTALMRAASVADLETLNDALISTNFVNFQNPYTKKTALALCIERYDRSRAQDFNEAILSLLAAGADPRIQDWSQKSVMDALSSEGAMLPKHIQERIHAKANRLDSLEQLVPLYESNALMFAAERNDKQRALELLKEGVNPNVVNIMSGKTAIFFAIQRGHEDLTQVLLNFGADPFLREHPRNVIKSFRNKASYTAIELLQNSRKMTLDLNQAHLITQNVKVTDDNDQALLNKYFDRIYVIDSEQGRYESFLKRLQYIGNPQVELISGSYFQSTDYNHSTLGTLDWSFFDKRTTGAGQVADRARRAQTALGLKHYEAIKKAKREGRKQILILEANIHFKPSFVGDVLKAMRMLDSEASCEEWGLLYLDGNLHSPWLSITPHQSDKSDFLVHIDSMMLTNSAYVVRHTLFDEIISRFEAIFDKEKLLVPPFDMLLAEIQSNYKNAYFLSTLPAYRFDAKLP